MARRYFTGLITSAALLDLKLDKIPDLYAQTYDGPVLYKKAHIESTDLRIAINIRIGGEVTQEQAEMVLSYIMSKLEQIEFMEPPKLTP